MFNGMHTAWGTTNQNHCPSFCSPSITPSIPLNPAAPSQVAFAFSQCATHLQSVSLFWLLNTMGSLVAFHNLITCSLYHLPLLHKISLQPRHNFLSNAAYRQTDKQTNQCYQKYASFAKEVKIPENSS